MADSTPYSQKPHFPVSHFNSRIPQKPINRGKSCSNLLFKCLFFALFLVVLPLFPSQAPDFINQSLITKFWELLHLLFIGIAVAYGLFSRRTVGLEDSDMEETYDSSINNAPNYVSKMVPFSSIFGDGCDNPPGYDEKRMMMHCWNNSQYFEGDPARVVCSNGSAVGVFDEQYKPHLPVSVDNFVDLGRFDGNGTNVVQAWDYSEYYHSEPVVVVSQPYYTVGEYGEVVGYKPLGLPVRSLRSAAREQESPKYINESDSSSGSSGSCSSKSSLHKGRDRDFGDIGPSNLEQEFNDAAGSSSPIPWRSRSRRMEMEKNHGNVTRPSHFGPPSVDETKFEALSSRSLQSTTSFSSHTSMHSSLDSISSDNVNLQVEDMGQKKTSYVPPSQNMNFQEEDLGKNNTAEGSSLSNGRVAMGTKGKHAIVSISSHVRPMSVDETQFEILHSRGSFSSQTSLHSSLDSVSSENMNFLQKEYLEAKKSSHGSSSSSSASSLSPPSTRNQETSVQQFHARGYSIGSLLQDDMKNLTDDLSGLNGVGGEDPPDNKEQGKHAFYSDSERPASIAKAPTKGKSVRTRRASGLTSETMKTGEICSKQTDEKVEKKSENVESALLMRKDKVKSGGHDLPLKGISKKNMDAYHPKPEVTFSNYCKRDMQEPSKNESKEDLDIKSENFQVSSDEDVVSECVNDSGLDSEVDKKASEFIAKFKEQIRLQKVGSFERSRGQKTIGNGNYIR